MTSLRLWADATDGVWWTDDERIFKMMVGDDPWEKSDIRNFHNCVCGAAGGGIQLAQWIDSLIAQKKSLNSALHACPKRIGKKKWGNPPLHWYRPRLQPPLHPLAVWLLECHLLVGSLERGQSWGIWAANFGTLKSLQVPAPFSVTSHTHTYKHWQNC